MVSAAVTANLDGLHTQVEECNSESVFTEMLPRVHDAKSKNDRMESVRRWCRRDSRHMHVLTQCGFICNQRQKEID